MKSLHKFANQKYAFYFKVYSSLFPKTNSKKLVTSWFFWGLAIIGTLVNQVAKAQCTLTATITNVTCDNRTTANTADDKYSFTLTVNATGATGGFVQVSDNGTGLGVQVIGEAKVYYNTFFISAGTKTLTITSANGACNTTVELMPPAPCSPTCIWDPLDTNPPYASSTIVRDCKGTIDESDDTVSGVLTITSGIPAGYTWDLDIKLNATGTQVQFVSTQSGSTAAWGPISVATLQSGYPNSNGFVLWFMLTGINDCLGDLFVPFPDCPPVICNAPTPTGTGASVCPDNTATLTASGCTTGFTATWFSNAGLTAQVGTGINFTTPILTQTTTYYVACVQNTAPTCKSSGVSVIATVKPAPTLTAATPICAQNGSTYSVTVTSNGTITANGGTVNGLTVSNIFAGTDVNITATLNGCTRTITVIAPNCNNPCNAPTPTGTGASVCPDNTATLTASGCTTGFTATWFSNAGLTAQVGTGINFTTPILTQTTTYYVACVQNTAPTCKSSGVSVIATVKPAPTIAVTATTCNQAETSFDVTFTATVGATVTADKGTVSGNTVTGIPSGQTVKLIVTLNGCKDSTTATKNCSIPCIKSTVTVTATPVCSADVQTYSLTFTVTNKVGTIKVNKGILTGSNPYIVTGIPSGATIKITDSLSAVCKFDTLISGPNCNCNPALPTLLTPSMTACIGDTFPTLKATVVGLATVEWFTQATGGTPVFTGLNYKPAGTVPMAGAVFYAQARSTDPTCPTAISTTRVQATINAQDCTKEVDLALKKSINKKIAQIGDILTYTIKVWNESNTNATGVEVTDSIPTTVQFVAGSFVASRGSAVITGNVIKWTIGNIAANGDTVTLTYRVKATQEGVHFNTAEICKTNEKDVDSTPCNGEEDEDDIARQCFTVPVKLCPGEKVEVTVPAHFTNVQWFKNGSSTVIGSGNVILLSEVGTYTFTATNQTCPVEGCCPVIIEPGINCCPEDLCIPFTIKKTKKGTK